jgi:hypothetical protein
MVDYAAMKRLFFAPLILMSLASQVFAQNKINVFPQVADGAFSDGSYYKTTFMVLPFENSAATCALRLQGLGVNLGQGRSSLFTINVAQGSYFVGITAADQSIATGYAVLTCSDYVFAQALYSFYAANGTKIAEATVFASDADIGDFSYRMIADQRGSNLGIAIANDTDLPRTYRFTVGTLSQTVTVPARSSLPRFVTEILPATANTVGVLKIESVDFSDFYAIGLRYTGAAFTTVPAN